MTTPPHRPNSIVILGGGTAGWMAAMLFQHRWGATGTKVTLKDSACDRNLAAEEILRQGIDDVYAPLSWHCLLGGYGNYPAAPLPAHGNVIDMADVKRFVAGCAVNFPTHNDALAALR